MITFIVRCTGFISDAGNVVSYDMVVEALNPTSAIRKALAKASTKEYFRNRVTDISILK